MGTAKKHVLGHTSKFCAKRETTFGTFVKPTSAAPGSIKILAPLSVGHDVELFDRDFTNPSSIVHTATPIEGRKSTEWSIEKELIVSGAAGTAPEDDPLLLSVFPDKTINASTSVVYKPSPTQGAMGSLSLVSHGGFAAMVALAGAWVNEWKITQDGPNPPRILMSGGAKDLVSTGKTVATNISSADVTVTDPTLYEAGSVVAFYNPTTLAATDTNSGSGYQVSSKAGAVLTLASAPATASNNDVIAPFTPTESYAGNALGGTVGTLTVQPSGGSLYTLEPTKLEFTHKTGEKPHDNVCFSQTPIDKTEGRGESTGMIELRVKEDTYHWLCRWQNAPTGSYDVICLWGSTAGSRFEVRLQNATIRGLPQSWPGGEEAVMTINLKGLGTSATASDSLVATYK